MADGVRQPMPFGNQNNPNVFKSEPIQLWSAWGNVKRFVTWVSRMRWTFRHGKGKGSKTDGLVNNETISNLT